MSDIDQAKNIAGGFNLDDKVTIVTGAGSGMGRASALTFAAAGATVYAVDIDETAVKDLADHAQNISGSIIPIAMDATNDHSMDELVSRVDADHGRLDVLFNHAGRACAPGPDITNDDWLTASDLNLRVPIIFTSKMLPLLRKSKAASLIYTASIAGLVASPNSPLYSAVKHAVVGYSRAMAATLGSEGIRANVICPGTMETPMLVDFFRRTAAEPATATRESVDTGVGTFTQLVPLGRTGFAHEIAAAALFLASDNSSYITGTSIPVDGGYTCR